MFGHPKRRLVIRTFVLHVGDAVSASKFTVFTFMVVDTCHFEQEPHEYIFNEAIYHKLDSFHFL